MRIEEIRVRLCAGLRARRDEIEQSALNRVHAVSDPSEIADPEYTQGLRAAISAAIDYGIDALERSEERAPQIPMTLLSQARLAARNRVSLDTVLRRYFAGYTLLSDFVIEEAEGVGLVGQASLKRLLRLQAVLFDQLIVAVTDEYSREAEQPGSVELRRAERIERLLGGALIDTSDFRYDMDGWHLATIVVGPEGATAIRDLARSLDQRTLLVERGDDMVWAWLGARLPLDPTQLQSSTWPPRVSVTVGEAARGLSGWRLTHRQAAAALSVARRSSQTVIRYADVALLASIVQDDLLATSLREVYLAPLEGEREGGEALRATLRAYISAGRNVSSAATVLRVKRHTVTNRLRAVEELIGRPLDRCVVEIEMALRLEEIEQPIRAARA